jgi:hypothetical protein
MIKAKEKPILTAEAKKLFVFEAKQMNPAEVLIVHEIIQKSSLSAVDKKFCISHIGRRAERLLRNVALYQDWERMNESEEGEHDD